MDTRLTELLPAALGLKNGDAKIIKNAGGVITHPYGSVVRSLLVAILELGVEQVIAAGGGIVKSAENRELLRMNCVVAHITRPIEALPMDGRPLSQGREALVRLWRERAALYAAAADAEVENGATAEDCWGWRASSARAS